ncbi:MAG: F0F1 ATP synthase subunit B [Phycisphaerales bacterium]|nr:F0F1 ATP synthase subunit B [Planctomycetota bacterium]MCH8509087.1 F0F1 ATP synthase subunit B [Phycisphaerales bacterium]
MSMLKRTAALTALAMMTATVHAADDLQAVPTMNSGIVPAITALVVFVISAAFLGTVVWPKLNGALDERAAKIRSEIESAEEARRQAREALEEYERNLAEARAEAQKMLEETRAQQGAMAAEIRSKADAELSHMRAKAKVEIEAAKKQAIAEIYSESVLLATAMAGKILEREVSATDHKRLTDESIDQLRSANA